MSWVLYFQILLGIAITVIFVSAGVKTCIREHHIVKSLVDSPEGNELRQNAMRSERR